MEVMELEFDVNNCICCLDYGTSGLDLAIMKPDGSGILCSVNVKYHPVPGLPNRYSEQVPQDWIDAIPEAAKHLVAKVKERTGQTLTKFAAIGISGHMHGAVFLDGNFNALYNCIMWDCSRGHAEAEILTRASGAKIPGRLTLTRVMYAMGNMPDVWADTRYVSVPSAFIGQKLTGKFGVGVGDARGMSLLTTVPNAGFAFDPGFLGLVAEKGGDADCDILSRLPVIGVSGEFLGAVSEEGAKLFGPLELEGVPVAFPEGDQPCVIAGAGVDEAGTDCHSYGSSGTANVVLDSPFKPICPEIDPFCTASGQPTAMACATNCSSGFNAVVDLVAAIAEMVGGNLGENPVGRVRELLTEAMHGAEPGCGGAMSLAFMSGTEQLHGLGKRAVPAMYGFGADNFTIGNIARSMVEAACRTTSHAFDVLEDEGLRPNRSVLTGGGANNPVILQTFADMTNTTVLFAPDAEDGSALGAGRLALHALRRLETPELTLSEVLRDSMATVEFQTCEPNTERVAAYQAMMPAYAELVEQQLELLALPMFSGK